MQRFQMVELVQPGSTIPVEASVPHDCAELQREAYERGRQAGWEEGRAQCQGQVEEELNKAIRLANHLGQARIGALEAHEQDIVEVALAIARKLILKEAVLDKDLVVRKVRQVFKLLSSQELVTLKVHPRDYETLMPLQQQLQVECAGAAHLALTADEEVEPGGCLVEQAGFLFDARLTSQLAAVAGEFGLEEA